MNSSPQKNNCLTNISKEENIALFVGHCDDLQVDGKLVGGYQGGCYVALKTGQSKANIAHELAHVFAPHTFDAIPLPTLHPDLLEATCDPVSHGDELITSLSYWDKCRDKGFPDTSKHNWNSRGEWGLIDLTLAKLSTHREHDETHIQIHAEGVGKSYEWIRQNYGHRSAEQFVGSFVKTIFIHSMSAIAVRSIIDKRALRLSKVLIHTFGNLLHFGVMSQSNTDQYLGLGYSLAGQGWMGKTARAVVDVMGDAALLRSFVQLMQGNSDYMLQMVFATCGTPAGNAFSQLIHGFIEMCAPTDAQ